MPAEGGAAYAIRIALPQDAVEEVFAERGARQIYTQPGGGYEITTEILDAAPAAAIVRRLSGFDASALHVYKSGGKNPARLAVCVVRGLRRGRAYVPLQGDFRRQLLLRADRQRAGGRRHQL